MLRIQKPRFGGAFFYVDADALYTFESRGFGGEIGLNRLLFPLFLTRSCRLQSFPDNLLPVDFKDRHGIVSVVAVAEKVR